MEHKVELSVSKKKISRIKFSKHQDLSLKIWIRIKLKHDTYNLVLFDYAFKWLSTVNLTKFINNKLWILVSLCLSSTKNNLLGKMDFAILICWECLVKKLEKKIEFKCKTFYCVNV